MMERLFDCGIRAIRSITAPGMFGIFILSVVITIAALIGFVMLAGGLFATLMADNILLAWAGTIGASMLAWFLFPMIMPIIVSFFDIRIARTIEQHDYPAHVGQQEPRFWSELWHDVRFVTLAIGLNILVLPLYLLPGINLVLFYVVNGYLLGREFFVMCAKRHLPIAEARDLRKKNALLITLSGVALAFLATVPLLNLLAPFWGIAMMTHLYHSLRGTPGSVFLLPN